MDFDRYQDWLVNKVVNPKVEMADYRMLFHLLLLEPYIPTMIHDENDATRGLKMRDEYKELEKLDDVTFMKECSLLELFVSLAVHIEDKLMQDDALGDRTYIWFWDMIQNIGMYTYIKGTADTTLIHVIGLIFSQRRYQRDGHGGNIFITKNPSKDFRKMDLWAQANTWLLENYEDDDWLKDE